MRWVLLLVSVLVCAPLPALGQGHDYPSLGHIKGYHLVGNDYWERTFDAATFEAAPGGKVQVQGHIIHIDYRADDDKVHGSQLEIYLNYETVLKSLKAEILADPKDSNHLFARFYRNSEPVYVDINADDWGGSRYTVDIAEQKEFQPSIVTSPGQ
jgi:hypothetical protein